MRLISEQDRDYYNQQIDRMNSSDAAAKVAWAFLAVICFFGVGGIGCYFNSSNTMIGALIGTVLCSLLSRMSGTHLNDPNNL